MFPTPHGRSPGTVAHLANTTLRQLVVGMDAAGTAIAMSGIDMALWDLRGKAVGWPLDRLLGGASRAIPAYAGGVSLGCQDPAALVDEARPLR